MTRVIHISASQINAFTSCRRSWAWYYINKLPKPERAATDFGSYTHKILEDFGSSGKVPDPNEVWRWHGEGREYLPGKTALQMIDGLNNIVSIEKLRSLGHFEGGFSLGHKVLAKYGIEIPEDVSLVGVIDIYLMVEKGHLIIIDHKTSSDPIKWGKTEEDLENDTQAIMYMMAAPISTDTFDKVDKVSFWLNYGSSKAQPTKKYQVGLTLSKKEVYKRFKHLLLPTIHEMAELKRNKVLALEQEPNPGFCNMFSGCERKSDCRLTVAQRMKGLRMGNARLDAIKAKIKSQTDPVNPPETSAAPKQTPAQAATEAEELEKPKTRGRPPKKTRAVKAPATTKTEASPVTEPPPTPQSVTKKPLEIGVNAIYTLYGLACAANKEAADETMQIIKNAGFAL